MLKKLAIVLGSLVALFLIVAIAVPLLVDVDQYRPQIVQAAQKQLNGKLELGKLKLSLWGQVRIDVAGFTLSDSQGRKIVSVADAFFHLPFLPLLSGSPVVSFQMREPALSIVKDKSGKLNVLSLVKESPAAEAQAPAAAAGGAAATSGAPAASSGSAALPAIALAARLGLEIREAKLAYVDETQALTTQIDHLNVILRDLSLSRPTTLEIWADLDTRMGKTMTVKGPVRAEGKAELKLEGAKIAKIALELLAKADDLDIQLPGLFHKKPGMATHAELSLQGTGESVQIQKLNLAFFNVKLEGKGSLARIDSENASVQSFAIQSNPVDLKAWNELVPMLKEYELGGTLTFDAQASGPTSKLDYAANLAVKSLTMKAPNLKAQPTFDANARVKTDQIEAFSLTMKAPANDLKVAGKLVSFKTPRLDAMVTSTGMDLDQLIVFPPPAAKKGAAVSFGIPSAYAEGKAAQAPADYDALLDPMRESPVLSAMSGLVQVNLNSVKAYGVKMAPLLGKLTLKDLTATLSDFSMGVFGGTVKATMAVAMKPKAPTYSFTASVASLDLQQAVSSQFELFKNTLLGSANFSIVGKGASFNPDPAKRNLDAKGTLKVTDAKFATIDIGKMVTEGINSSIGKIADKVPALKGKGLNVPASRDSKYEYISSDFTIAGGKFSAPNFVTKTYPNQGIDLKGRTSVGLLDYALDTRWEVIDTHNLTKAKDISVNVGGAEVPGVLTESGGAFRMPVSAGCNAMSPCFNYGEAPTFLASVAMKNVQNAAVGRAKQEAQSKVQEAIKAKAPAPVQNILNGLFK